jgi:phosphoribosyl 1,2-cyclic phosphodiesterase
MLIRFWGARGSIPVSGKNYLKYGGDTTCVEIRNKKDQILIIDAGTGIRRLGNRLVKEGKKELSILFTHAHWDHLLGFPFFKPIYKEGTIIQTYGCAFTQESLQKMLSTTMSPPNFPVKLDQIKAQINYHETCEQTFRLMDLDIIPIPLSHPNYGITYKIVEDGKSFIFLTDNELTYQHPGGLDYEGYLEVCKDVDLLIHDAEYLPSEYKYTKTWGHTIYTDALKLALEANATQFGLFHHNQNRTDKQIDKMVADCKEIIKEKNKNLDCFAVHTDLEIEL